MIKSEGDSNTCGDKCKDDGNCQATSLESNRYFLAYDMNYIFV